MPDYYAPGVYIEEVEIGSKPVEGVSTSVTAFIGAAENGPILKPVLISSWNDFETQFGGLINKPLTYLGYAVDSYFRNGGKTAYIVRVAGSNAVRASYKALGKAGNPLVILESLEYGANTKNTSVSIETDVKISKIVDVFKKTSHITSDISAGKLDITVDDVTGFEVGDKIYIVDSKDSNKNETTHIKAVSEKLLTVEGLKNGYSKDSILRAQDIGGSELRVQKSFEFFPGSIVLISDGDKKKEYAVIKDVQGNKLILEKGLSNTFPLDESSPKVTLVSLGFDLVLKNGEGEIENFTKLSVDPRHPRYFKRLINSKLVSVSLPDNATVVPVTEAHDLIPVKVTDVLLAGGSDDDLSGNINYVEGLKPLEEIDGISLIAIPGQAAQSVHDEMIAHCRKMKYRFAILDCAINQKIMDVKAQRANIGSKEGYAAFYYPWIQIIDPVTREPIYIPPSGAVAGVYARSDSERGVHKAPANEQIYGAIGLEKLITREEQELLNPEGINAIRFFKGKGYLVWGARTIAGDPLWKYINVRRLFIYLEESIEKATQWAVFEPNNEKLWGRIKATITEFLTRVWRDGALMGTKAEEAFFVTCDRTTMTQSDIDNGRLIVLIGIAPTKPAEFVVFKIAQWTGGAKG